MSTESKLNELDSKTAYDKFVPLARELAQSAIQPFRGEPNLVFHNVKTGTLAVLEHAATLGQVLPQVDAEIIKDLPNLAMAVSYAALQVNRLPEATELADIFPRVCELRRKMLASAVALEQAGLLPVREVEAIRRGVGKIDAASDAVQLSTLFQAHEKEIEHKHPITPQDITEAGALGTRALTILKPQGVDKNAAKPAELASQVDIRDRLWTLLVQRYNAHLWRAGAWLFFDDVDSHVPPLMSRKSSHQKKDEPAPPAPIAAQ